MIVSRRALLAAGVVAFVAACNRDDKTPSAQPTPSCTDGDDDLTPSQTEGPYFTPDSPEKTDLRADVERGTTLDLGGVVMTTSCRPVARALVDVWQCDGDGRYDNDGYTLRGHQFTDAEGRYRLRTVVPGLYPGRTRHIHVKVQAPDGPVLTTQLYFPDEPANGRDPIFREECLIRYTGDTQTQAAFDFVVG